MIDTSFPLIVTKPNPEFLNLSLELVMNILISEYNLTKKVSKCEGVFQRNVVLCDLGRNEVDSIINVFEIVITNDKQLGEVGQNFIVGLRKLMEYKKEVESVQDSEEDRKTDACIGVMKYFLKHNNLDLYFSYAHKLSQTHKALGNFIEAAISLLLHAEKLKFGSSEIKPKFSQELPEQRECERKESLYFQSISLFEKGNDMENAIKLCKELQKYYEEISFEYDKLDKLLVRMGENYKNIMSKKRFYSSYFFVGKYGKSWKEEEGEYIYRGSVLENHVDFASRLQKIPGNTDSIKVNKRPDKLEDGKKYIEVYTINPSNSNDVNNIKTKVNPNTHPKISSYANLNAVYIFYKDKRFDTFQDRTGIKKLPQTYNQYKNLCREITYYYVEENFPSIQRRQKN